MMPGFLSKIFCSLVALFFFSYHAYSADFNDTGSKEFKWLDEMRFGAYVHSPGYTEGNTLSLSGELLSSKIQTGFHNKIADFILGPRLHIGFTLNAQGKTSFAYSGVSWTYDVSEKIFVEASFGGGLHNGELEPPVRADRLKLGCRVLFREGATLGYRFSPSWSLMASVEHLSHAGLCSDFNNGITTTGARIGYSF